MTPGGTAAGGSAVCQPFGETADGQVVRLFTLTNANGLVVRVSELGATITDLRVPDSQGRIHRVVLGYDSLAPYLDRGDYLGAVVGRYAGRIEGGRISLAGTRYQLALNEGGNHLHGGVLGFDKQVWAGDASLIDTGPSVRMRLVSPDGDQGYPARLEVCVYYVLTHDDRLLIEYHAIADAMTIINLTNHSYFNLCGNGSNDVLTHELTIHGDQYLPLGPGMIPTGEIDSVEGTPLDFRSPRRIGQRLGEPHGQLTIAGGYDHTWVLGHGRTGAPVRAATLREPSSGREMSVWTTEPGLHVYTGNSLGGGSTDAKEVAFRRHSGVCMETQHFPNSPNVSHFPSTWLAPGEAFRSRTVFAFAVRPQSRV